MGRAREEARINLQVEYQGRGVTAEIRLIMAGPRGGLVGGGRGGALENSISIQMPAVTYVPVRWRSFCLSRYGVGFKVPGCVGYL